ncbi:MAG TPA: PDZ domain-containing protein [Vicinamibacterales bacterium]|nr:PDZ domain-containing protein [Vicinamibacterales bacterium]
MKRPLPRWFLTNGIIFTLAFSLVVGAASFGLDAQNPGAPIRYRFTFPEPEHRWMQVEISFGDLAPGPLELRMSRASPGRYSLHDFAKNVYDVHAYAEDGQELQTTRPDPYGWNVPEHGARASVKYKIYGDRVDGTYLAIDRSHAHINMPAAIMWARGLDERPLALVFEQPAGAHWQVATQLHPVVPQAATPSASGRSARSFELTAPNLQYLMDSPTEFGPVAIRQFSIGSRIFRFAAHHTGTDAELDDFVKAVEKIVRQEGAIYGEYPEYEPGSYTFLAEYLPYANGDGMEHRNSTVITDRGSIAQNRARLLDTVAHEFFHSWNVERIRPKSLEPFDFERADMSGELWLAEGFTQYYGPLALRRAGLDDLDTTARTLTGLVDTVENSPGRLVRSAEDMSRMAPFIDGGQPVDRTNWSDTVVSYYPFGGAIALALDLTLRERSDSRLSLDDFMRAMWIKFGKPGGTREGYVDRPYTIEDAEATLAEVASDRSFAHEFFARYIRGRDVADYDRLLARAGFSVRRRSPGLAWLGDLRLDAQSSRQSQQAGLRVNGLVSPTWPAYRAGLDQDDEVQRLDGHVVSSPSDLAAVLQRHKPGDAIEIAFTDRSGTAKTATVTLSEDPHVEVVPLESSGGSVSAAQRTFRERWLEPKS